MNYISLHDYRNAILLALAMGQPGRLFSLFKSLAPSHSPGPLSSITGNPTVDEVLRTLPGPDLARLLRYIRDWNTNAKTSEVAQRVLHVIVKLRAAEEVTNAFVEAVALDDLVSGSGPPDGQGNGSTALKAMIDSLIPYTERHLARMEKLVQESYIVDYLLGEMDDGMFSTVEEHGIIEQMDIDVTA